MPMKKTALALTLVLGLIIILLTGYFLTQVISNMNEPQQTQPQSTNEQNPIFCYAKESWTSDWRKTEGYPVLASYSFGTQNFSSLPNVNLGVRISNNNNIALFNVEVEVTYRTVWNTRKTTEKVNIGFLDIQQNKQARITLVNPYLSLWDTRRPDSARNADDPETKWENVTVYVLDVTDCKITAYGFAKP